MALKNIKRPRVYMPPFEGVWETPDPAAGAVAIFFGDRERWFEVRERLIVDAVCRLAIEADADPAELMKVRHLLVEVIDKKPGRRELDVQKYLEVRMKMETEGMTQERACKECSVDPKTFRAATRRYRAFWKAWNENQTGKTID